MWWKKQGGCLTPPRLKHRPSFSSGDRALEMSVICRPPHTPSLSLGTQGRRRETPPTIFNFHLGCRADTMATEGWRPRVSGCCRYPSMPREAMTTTGRRGAGAMETKDQTRAVPNIVLVKEQTRAQVQGLKWTRTGCLSGN